MRRGTAARRFMALGLYSGGLWCGDLQCVGLVVCSTCLALVCVVCNSVA